MTIDDAQTRISQIRSEAWVKEHARLKAKSNDIIEWYRNLRSAFLTDADADADADAEDFQAKWLPEKRVRITHWHTMQKIIVDIELHPSEWYEQSSKMYAQFVSRRFSPNYCKKLLRYLNIWGYFICKKQGKAWKDVEGPDAHWKIKIDNARISRIKRATSESDPLTPAQLLDVKAKCSTEHYNWLLISVWFGLRPREVDNFLKDNSSLWRIETDKQSKFVVCVFQEKLYERGIAKEKCWKFIPTVFPEQVKAVAVIRSKVFKQPLSKRIKEVLGVSYTAYAGRKNFTDMLRDAGYDLEAVSRWMGHLSVKTTEKDYSKNTKVFYRPPIRKAG